MSDLMEATSLLERLVHNHDRLIRPAAITQAQLLLAADAQVAFIGKGSRRDITFVCVRCGLPQSFRLWEHISRLGTDKIQTHVGQECVGRHLKNRIDLALADELNALRVRAGAINATVGCDWAVFGFMADLGRGIDVVMPSGRVTASFPLAPIELAQTLYTLLDRSMAPPPRT